jgi:hypothetical protein
MARTEAQVWCLAGAKGLAFLSIREAGQDVLFQGLGSVWLLTGDLVFFTVVGV